MTRHESKKDVIGVGSSMTPSFIVSKSDLSVSPRDKPSDRKKLEVKIFNDLDKGKVPKAKKDLYGTNSHEYKILKSLYDDVVVDDKKIKVNDNEIKTPEEGEHLRKDKIKEKLLFHLKALDKSCAHCHTSCWTWLE